MISDNSSRNKQAYRYLIGLAGALFVLLGAASVWLYRERVLYIDSAYYAFNFINDGIPAAEHKRYALWLYQLLPWAMLKSGLSLKWVLMAYSICHILLHALVFVWLLRMKQYGLAVLLALMQVIAYRECFFLTVNETALAISATLLLSGYMRYFSKKHASVDTGYPMKNTLVQGFVYFACILTALFSHPTATLLIPFVIIFHLLLVYKDRLHRQAAGLALVEFAGLASLKMLAGNRSGYETDLFDQLAKSSEILSNLGNIYSFNFFFGEFKTNSNFFGIYWIPFALSFLSLFLLLKARKPLLLLFYAVSLIGLWLLIVVMFNRGDGTMFMEKNFTPWVLLALYPLVMLNRIKMDSPWTAGLYASVILFSIWGIYKVTPMYQKRLWLMDRLITAKNPEHLPKLLLNDSSVNHEEWLGIWALPYETLLLSKIKGMPATTAKIYHGEDHIQKELYRPDIFLGADFIPVLPDTALLNRRYFDLEDKPYRLIPDP